MTSDEDSSPFPEDLSYQDAKMTKLNYEWLRQYKDFEIEDNEHFLFIKYKGIPVNVYPVNETITEEFLKKETGKLERKIIKEK
jgi:hypothetical protein